MEATTSRREQDRIGVLDWQRTAHTARLHALFYEALADAVTEDPDLGGFADRAATILRRHYCAIAFELLDLALDADGYEADYRLHLTGERP